MSIALQRYKAILLRESFVGVYDPDSRPLVLPDFFLFLISF